MVRWIFVALLVFAPTLAYADSKDADACSTALPADAKMIYDAAAPGFPNAPDPRAEVKGKVQELVAQGKIDLGKARANAKAAGECLKKLR